ncbi:hypothetical protein GALMADRAFT_223982 [Galerina marginata CBS 339.88]|uniref:Uncharacterized protein n=1 Tax=Galerina marginata (strain CBS 339.88) TaxID=685588 RepID=A0A067TFN9_GALM3|nr:hypothetical protein GALMADRAFT_223982 [Galerina marginata CBS 339.88]
MDPVLIVVPVTQPRDLPRMAQTNSDGWSRTKSSTKRRRSFPIPQAGVHLLFSQFYIDLLWGLGKFPGIANEGKGFTFRCYKVQNFVHSSSELSPRSTNLATTKPLTPQWILSLSSSTSSPPLKSPPITKTAAALATLTALLPKHPITHIIVIQLLAFLPLLVDHESRVKLSESLFAFRCCMISFRPWFLAERREEVL